MSTSVLDLELLTVGSLKKAISGDVINGSLMAGEISSVISEIKPVKKIFEDIILEAKEANKKYLSLMDEINNL
jgi:enoyl-[acyl-carrier protein] reductase II